MAHHVLEEIMRVGSFPPQVMHFRKWQRLLRDEVQPLLDERDRLLEENAALKAQLAQPVEIVLDGIAAAEAAYDASPTTVRRKAKA